MTQTEIILIIIIVFLIVAFVTANLKVAKWILTANTFFESDPKIYTKFLEYRSKKKVSGITAVKFNTGEKNKCQTK